MNKLFEEYNDQVIENFEIIFDRAVDEKTAKNNAVEYYLCLLDVLEEDKHECIEINSIIDLAESYGYNFDDFEKLVKENM